MTADWIEYRAMNRLRGEDGVKASRDSHRSQSSFYPIPTAEPIHRLDRIVIIFKHDRHSLNSCEMHEVSLHSYFYKIRTERPL